MTEFPSLSYSYFEKGCRKRCTRQSRKVLWVVFCVHGSLKKFERMTGEAMDVCLPVLKESNKSRFDSCSVRTQCIDHIPYYLSGLSPAYFFRQPFSKLLYTVLQLVKFLSSHTPKAWKNYPFGRSLLVKAIIGSTPPRDFHYLQEKLHVYTINDIQLLKMYRLSCKSLGEQEHPRLEGVRIKKFLNRKKTWDRDFPDS